MRVAATTIACAWFLAMFGSASTARASSISSSLDLVPDIHLAAAGHDMGAPFTNVDDSAFGQPTGAFLDTFLDSEGYYTHGFVRGRDLQSGRHRLDTPMVSDAPVGSLGVGGDAVTPVPEPATLTLTAFGVVGAIARYRRRRAGA